MRPILCAQSLPFVLCVLGLIPVVGTAGEFSATGAGKGAVVQGPVGSGERFSTSGSQRMGEEGREGNDSGVKGSPSDPATVGFSGAGTEHRVYGWKESTTTGQPSPAASNRGWGWNTGEGSRYWDPPPEFRNEGDGKLPDPRFGDGRLPDPRFGDGRLPDPRYGDGKLPDPRFGEDRGVGSGSERDSSGEGRFDFDRSGASDQFYDSETLDPRREIDPYFLRKQQRRDVHAEPPRGFWGDGRSGAVDGTGRWSGDGYRDDGYPPSGSRFRQDEVGEGRFRDSGDAGRLDQGRSGDDPSRGTAYDSNPYEYGSGPYRPQYGDDHPGRVAPGGVGDSRMGSNGSGSSFSWTGGWENRGDRSWEIPSPGLNPAYDGWMRPGDGFRGNDLGYGPGYDPYSWPGGYYPDGGSVRGPWR
ncbi:MAG: hypothetical protein HQL81_13175 [Magnetococcales bacterium]|nr:hypothetical protein [Magnetococcales bacterium]